MKKAFVISLTIHLSCLITVLAVSHVIRASAKPVYPQVYKVSLVSLPQAPAAEPAEEQMTASQPQPTPEKTVSEKSKKGKKDKVKQTKKEEPKKKTSKSQSTPVPGLPQGMKIVASDGDVKTDSYYLALILSKISQYWRNPYQGKNEQVRTLIYFRLDKNGRLQEVKVEKSSGDAIFDQAGLRAVYEAKSFPPLPEEMKLSTLGVHFEFEYVK
jgi:colicin import membrane protein